MNLRPLVLSLVGILFARSAHADKTTASPERAPERDSMDACVSAADRAQLARDERHLIQARQDLLFCSADPCPLVLRKDCAKWLDDVNARLPGVVVSVRDEAEHDLVDVRVFVDGRLVAQKLDGKVLSVDPGEHVFRYEPSGRAWIEERVLVREGEANRLLTVRIRNPITTGAPATRPIPALSYALAGLGAVGVGSFAILAGGAKGSVQDLRDTCGRSQSCAESDVDSVQHRLVVANVALGVGVVAIAGAVWLYLTRGEAR